MRSSRRRQAAVAALRQKLKKVVQILKKHLLLLLKPRQNNKDQTVCRRSFSNIPTFFALVATYLSCLLKTKRLMKIILLKDGNFDKSIPTNVFASSCFVRSLVSCVWNASLLAYIKINWTHMNSNSTEVIVDLLVFGQKLTISVTVTVCTSAPVTFRSFFRHLGWWIGPNADHLLMSTLHTHTYYSWRVWIWNEPSSDALLEQWCERKILFFPKSQPCRGGPVLWCYPWV